MRFTLYPHSVDSQRPPFEIIVETDLIKQLLAEGEITPAEIVDTITRAVTHVQALMKPFMKKGDGAE